MIATRDQLKEVLSRREGDLAGIPFPILLLALSVNEKSAVLSLRRPPLEKNIVIDRGTPVDCRSNVATETIGRFMVATGRLASNDYHRTLSDSAARGVAFEDVLVERGFVSPSDLYRILQQNLARKLLDVFTWHSGTYKISRELPEVDSPLRVKVPQLIFTGLLKFATQPDIDEAVMPFRGKYLTLSEEPLVPVGELRLSEEQTAVVNALKRGIRFDELSETSSSAGDELSRILLAFAMFGAIEASDELVRRAPKLELEVADAPAPSQAASAPVVPAVDPRDAAKKREELMRVFLTFRRKDPFELFELPDTSSTDEISRAYLRFASRVAPADFPEHTAEALREKAEEVFLAAARAYGEVADPQRQEAVVAKRRRPREIPKMALQPEPELLTNRKEDLLDPELQYRKGRELADAGKLREALSHFEIAADCDAQNGTYLSELAYTRFQLFNTPAATTINSLKHAMRIDPRAGAAYLYYGRVQATLGNTLEAEAYVQRAARLMPGDRRIAEALKAIAAKPR